MTVPSFRIRVHGRDKATHRTWYVYLPPIEGRSQSWYTTMERWNSDGTADYINDRGEILEPPADYADFARARARAGVFCGDRYRLMWPPLSSEHQTKSRFRWSWLEALFSTGNARRPAPSSSPSWVVALLASPP